MGPDSDSTKITSPRQRFACLYSIATWRNAAQPEHLQDGGLAVTEQGNVLDAET
jgi:hypothetical protein